MENEERGGEDGVVSRARKRRVRDLPSASRGGGGGGGPS